MPGAIGAVTDLENELVFLALVGLMPESSEASDESEFELLEPVVVFERGYAKDSFENECTPNRVRPRIKTKRKTEDEFALTALLLHSIFSIFKSVFGV